MQAPQSNPQLAGMPQRDVLVLAERLQLVSHDGFVYCTRRCVTHYGEDSVPYHPGEKACLDRCINKVYNGLELSRTIRKKFEGNVRKAEMPYRWMKDIASTQAN